MSRAHRILTVQPRNPAQLELHDSPLTQGLASVFLDGYDVVLGKPFEIFTADLTKSFGRYGPQFTSAQAGTAAPYKTRFSYLGTGYSGPLTVSALCRYENVVANGLFSIGDNDGNSSAGLGVKTSLSGSAYLRAILYTSSSTNVIATSAIVPDNAYHTVTATWDGSNVITLYLDGEIIATQTGATVCYLPESLTIGAFGAAGGTGDVALATYHKRCLTPPEVRSLAYQPWQIFKAPTLKIGIPNPTSYTLTCNSGTYTTSGKAATLSVSRTLVCSTGTYTTSGKAATLQVAHTLVCATGTYTTSGKAATLTVVRNYKLTCSSGSYTSSGKAATLSYVPGAVSYTLTCSSGVYALSGKASTLTYVSHAPVDYTLICESGTYAVSGKSATLLYVSHVILVSDPEYIIYAKSRPFKIKLQKRPFRIKS